MVFDVFLSFLFEFVILSILKRISLTSVNIFYMSVEWQFGQLHLIWNVDFGLVVG